MDCDPIIEIDVATSELGKVYLAMVGRDREPEAKQNLLNHIYNADEHGLAKKSAERQKYLSAAIAVDLKRELKREFGSRGVLSFGTTWNSPLMWSHYADQHKGICLEYSTTAMPHPDLKPVNYNAGRAINASDLFAWKVRGDEAARSRVCETYFYAKAPHWKYEREWRDIRDKVGVGSSYEISGVYFGHRCDDAARIAVVKMLADHPNLSLFDIGLSSNGFGLRRGPVDRDEILAQGIRPPMEIMMHQFVQDIEDLDDGERQEEILTEISTD
ncbi:hypothetical protein DD559_06760 [Sphingomonas pokkalii]|uniref:DUF2971 domain-containing protein n=2 Tax=Sphingomonas pokkalii TaxID=2175090 RepID=A0A2U0SCQ1_9SPHN|nr:hypothetical protein DD559_06760 [Sphingomonas pokkalii]